MSAPLLQQAVEALVNVKGCFRFLRAFRVAASVSLKTEYYGLAEPWFCSFTTEGSSDVVAIQGTTNRVDANLW